MYDKEELWQKLSFGTGCYESRFANSRSNYRNVELEKQRAFLLRNKSLLNLEKLLVDFETHFNENGGNVLWARDADDARQMIWELVNKRDIHAVMRSNSVTLDEIGIDSFLKNKKMELYETGIARYVLKSAGQAPYHPIFPAIHLSKEEINGVLNEQYKLKLGSTSRQMVNFVRFQVNQDIAKAEVCLTGANYLLADVGGVALTENEGNILKASSSAKIHIVVAGLEKVIPSIDDLSLLLPLMSSHATGHHLSAINSITTGPSENQSLYVILLDNGRTDVLNNEVIRQSLSCIRCGACINVCPIYKNVGIEGYGTPYIGPIGTVMTPLMYGLESFQNLASLCTLCGRCSEICPVKIPIENLVLENRRLVAMKGIGNARFEALVKTLIGHCRSRKKMDCPQWFKKMEMKQLLKGSFTKRNAPVLAPKSFNQLCK